MEKFRQSPPVKEIFAGKTVLIVDESAALRQVIGEIFHGLQCQVLMAAGRQEAASHFRQTKRGIDLVLLELDLTINGGEEVYGFIQTELPGSKVLVISSFSEEEVQGRIVDGVSFLRKPFFIADLVEQAQILLDFPGIPNQVNHSEDSTT